MQGKATTADSTPQGVATTGPKPRGAATGISATEPDWTREKPQRWWDPGPKLLASIRAYQRYRSRGGPIRLLMSKFCVLRHRFWSVCSGASIPLDASIGGGLRLPHPNGVVIHPDSIVGPNCLLLQQVTLGVGGRIEGAPVLAGHVDVCAGARILGKVHIGAHAVIGANAVVLRDVPDNATAVGVPARVAGKESRKMRQQLTDGDVG